MQHRDKIILQKIVSEIDVGIDMLGNFAHGRRVPGCSGRFSCFERTAE